MEIKMANNSLFPRERVKGFELRPYQVSALDALHAAIQERDILLLQAATGAGKTVMIVRLINKYFHDHPGRNFLVVMHKKELVEQFVKSFFKFSDIPLADIGIACAGVNKTVSVGRRVTVASVQTLVNHLDKFPGADLVVVDETHRIGHDFASQYQKLMQTLRDYKPHHKVIGVTATAYRLGHGMIYGDRCKPGRTNFFPELTHRVTYKELVENNHLMPLRGFITSHESITEDLKAVKVSGDYNLGQLGDVMSNARHIDSAVDGYEKYGLEHNSVCVFACTIEHAELLCEAFNKRGHRAVSIHSQLPPLVRDANLRAWQSGEVKVAVSINILVEGFDFPALSCLVFCRPTKSPTLYIQGIGRILRTSPGKKEALLIDLTDNTLEFGLDIDNPKFTIPRNADGEGGDAPTKVCPGEMNDGTVCAEPVHAALKYCPVCGYEFETTEEVQAAMGEMKKVDFNKLPDPEPYDVERVEYEAHESRNSGKTLIKATYFTGYLNPKFHEWICLPDNYDGFAVNQARAWWEERTNEPFPETVEEFLFLSDTLMQPARIITVKEGKYHRVIDCQYVESGDVHAGELSVTPESSTWSDKVPF